MEKPKSPSASKVCKTEIVCPNDTNSLGILLGGRLVQWMDIAAAACAQMHAGKICVTASIDTASFEKPALVGDIIIIEAKITRAFNTSMEIMVRAWSRNVYNTQRHLIGQSYFTFVALDEKKKASRVPSVKPVTFVEKELYEAANGRKYNP